MQLTLKLDAIARRPVLKLGWFNGCRALLDTGALFPVWTGKPELLQKLGARKIREEEVTYGGFGGTASGYLYRVNFMLGNIVYVDMPIVATQMPDLNCHIILPATMFDKMVYEIDTVNHVLSIDTRDNQIVRLLRLSDDGNRMSAYLAGTFESMFDYRKSAFDNAFRELQNI